MDPQLRFEIIQQIAQGDFATIYRARDRELGREVAIKQIHPQYLQDPRHLDRYWQEAQILASLEHPHIVRIYDLVRDRGWLVLELMQGSLQQLLDGRPIDLNDLRMTLTYTCHALQFMHANGILHGDVKPSNLLVDKSQRVKLGDFGIARRIFGDHGSVVKGTTRYMAPEVVSDQFGPVGPHSDLYSLGFSAYELLCGSNFDSLFPGLNMYGRDQQIAWMMWHSALDRRLPEIQRVLEGVPPDLAYVIHRLIEKDASKRYRSAEEVLTDLRSGATGPIGPSREQLAAEEAERQRQAKRKRWLAIGACVLSVSATLAMVFMPAPSSNELKPATVDQRPTAGRVGEIDRERNLVFVQPDGAARPYGLELNPDRDRIFINEQRGTLADLRHNERVEIQYLSSGGQEIVELSVTRAAESELRAAVQAVDVAAAVLSLTPADGQSQPVPLYVPDGTSITLNGQTRNSTRALQMSDLQANDRVTARYVPSDEGRFVARRVDVQRRVTWQGVVVSRVPNKNQVEIRLSAPSAEPGSPAVGAAKSFTVAADCRLTINGQDHVANAVVNVADLQPGDVVRIDADSQAHGIDATRELRASGTIAEVDIATRLLTLSATDQAPARKFRLAPHGSLRLGTDGPSVDFSFLRTGDRVEFELAAASDPTADRQVDAARVTPSSDPRGWAVLIGQQEYEDERLPKLTQPLVDLAAVRATLAQRYRVPESQILTLENSSRLRLQQEIGAFLPKIPPDAQLVCFYSGLAYLDAVAGPVLAPKEFDSSRAAETGTLLRWLVDQLENAPAREKILLLDTSPAVPAESGPPIPSAFEIVEALRPKPMRPVSASVLVVGSCAKGQRSRAVQPGQPSYFAATVAAAFAGSADANRDQRIGGVELVEYVVREVAAAAGDANPQRAVAWLPENRPPRLTAPVREAVLRFLAQTRTTRLDETLGEEFVAINKQSSGQPDLALAYALALLKHNRTPLSRPIFERVRSDHRKNAVAHQALAWQNFLQGKYVEGLADSRQLVDCLPDAVENPQYEPYFAQAVELAGALREFALRAAEPPVDAAAVKPLDQAILARGEAAKGAYQRGIDGVRAGLKRIDSDIADTTDVNKLRSLQLDRRRLTNYKSFNFAAVAEFLRQGSDD